VILVGGSANIDGIHSALLTTALNLSSDSGSDQRVGANSAFADFSSPQSTSICMAGIESSTPACAPGKSARLPDASDFDNASARTSRSFQWPGIDAIMESYQLHMEGWVVTNLTILYVYKNNLFVLTCIETKQTAMQIAHSLQL